MKWILMFAFVVVGACAGDTRSGPAAIPNVTGVWNINWSNLNATNVSCFATGGRITLAQSGTTFSGAYSSALVQCNGTALGTASGVVVNGYLIGNVIAFDMDTPDLHQSGTVTGSSMIGSATWRIEGNGTIYLLTGTWAAAR